MTTRSIQRVSLLAILISASGLVMNPESLAMTSTELSLLNTVVGQVDGKCCKPGRRWGCSPWVFSQTGCVNIEQQYPNCQARPIMTMKCTAASCQPSSSEDICSIRIATVGKNRCQPLGTKTTEGCPPDHWQCKIRLFRYDSNDAPTADVYVCDYKLSTICSSGYSHCD